MALTVLYDWPVTTPGTTTPAPSSQQPRTLPTSTTPFNEVRGRLVGDSTSTSVVITHNLALSASEIACDFPKVGLEPIVSGGPSWWVITRATNTVTIGLSTTSAVTFAVFNIERPYSPSR